MPKLPSTIFPFQVVATVLQTLGLLCTIWRVGFRLKIGRFWWEDAWAVVSFFSCLVSVVGQWMSTLSDGLISILGVWFHTIGFTCLISAVHLSILFSIIRITQPGSQCLHKFTRFCMVCFVICWAILISAKVWECASNPSWQHLPYTTCTVKPQILIYEIASDCISVGVLVVLPLRMLWRVKLPRRQRRMLLSIFAASIVLMITALIHMFGRVLQIGSVVIVGVDLEVASSIIVCNLLVVVTFLHRFLSRNEAISPAASASSAELEAGDDFTRSTCSNLQEASERTMLTLTTVELDIDSSTTRSHHHNGPPST